MNQTKIKNEVLERAVSATLQADPDRPGVSTHDEKTSRYANGVSAGVAAAVSNIRKLMDK